MPNGRFANKIPRSFLIGIVFWLHVSVGVIWYGLFLVPVSLWPEKISFHFFFTLLIIGHQLVWGALIMPWTKQYRMVCILTTIMQWLRGKNIADPENYDHSFTVELLRKKTHLNVPHWVSTALNILILAAVSIQFFTR